ncbi:MAG TPA: hypothetical protein VGC21_25730 [Telluria sp.]|jgi:flagellar basal body L-ring protein FlgH
MISKKLVSRCLGLFLALICSASAMAETAIVYCMPFTIETYSPVTPERVRSSAREKWTIHADSQVAQLRALLRQGEAGTFSDRRVRCAVDIATVSYYIDAEGNARAEGQPDRRIDKEALISFGAALDAAQRESLTTSPPGIHGDYVSSLVPRRE